VGQYARVNQRAKAEGRSVGALIREAVDHMWTGTDERKAALLAPVTAVSTTDGLEGLHP
jgi:hypothetical protein